jgi:hypothetical protein
MVNKKSMKAGGKNFEFLFTSAIEAKKLIRRRTSAEHPEL